MPYEKLRSSLLAARDGRQALVDEAVAEAAGAVVALSLNVPGPVKSPAGAADLLALAGLRLCDALPAAMQLWSGRDALGPFALWHVPADPVFVKTVCIAIESGSRRARLLDFDVYTPAGAVLDRASLGLPPRSCLVCGLPARECARRSRHSVRSLVRAVRALLDDPQR